MSDLTPVIAARIRQCRNNHGWKIDETVKPLGITTSRYSNWEQAIRRPKLEEIIKLAQRFGVSPSYLAGFTDHSGNEANGMKFISVSSSTIPVGDAIIALQEVVDNSALSLDYIHQRGLNENKLTSVPAPDNTMADIIRKGDEVLIDRSVTAVKTSDIFALMVNRNVIFRWIQPELDGSFTIAAENKTHNPDQKISPGQLANLQILGRVTRICHDR